MKKIILNILLNLIIAIVFLSLNRWALDNQFEETFVWLALIYALVTILANAFYISKSS